MLRRENHNERVCAQGFLYHRYLSYDGHVVVVCFCHGIPWIGNDTFRKKMPKQNISRTERHILWKRSQLRSSHDCLSYKLLGRLLAKILGGPKVKGHARSVAAVGTFVVVDLAGVTKGGTKKE